MDFEVDIGRRTQTNILAGKVIRVKDDGTDVFEDYFSDSDSTYSMQNDSFETSQQMDTNTISSNFSPSINDSVSRIEKAKEWNTEDPGVNNDAAASADFGSLAEISKMAEQQISRFQSEYSMQSGSFETSYQMVSDTNTTSPNLSTSITDEVSGLQKEHQKDEMEQTKECNGEGSTVNNDAEISADLRGLAEISKMAELKISRFQNEHSMQSGSFETSYQMVSETNTTSPNLSTSITDEVSGLRKEHKKDEMEQTNECNSEGLTVNNDAEASADFRSLAEISKVAEQKISPFQNEHSMQTGKFETSYQMVSDKNTTSPNFSTSITDEVSRLQKEHKNDEMEQAKESNGEGPTVNNDAEASAAENISQFQVKQNKRKKKQVKEFNKDAFAGPRRSPRIKRASLLYFDCDGGSSVEKQKVSRLEKKRHETKKKQVEELNEDAFAGSRRSPRIKRPPLSCFNCDGKSSVAKQKVSRLKKDRHETKKKPDKKSNDKDRSLSKDTAATEFTGPRRSARKRVSPLAYWEGERITYKILKTGLIGDVKVVRSRKPDNFKGTRKQKNGKELAPSPRLKENCARKLIF